MPGQKMFWLPENPNANYFVLIAAAGNPYSAKTFVDTLRELLLQQIPSGKASLADVKRAIKGALKQLWFEHIDPAPENERHGLGCDLLIAVRLDMELHLYQNNRTLLVEEKQRACNGVGLYLARFLTDFLLDRRPSVGLAEQVVAYIIWATKENIQHVGKGSDIHILPVSGLSYSLVKPDRQDVEARFAELFSRMRDVIACASSDGFEENVQMRLDFLRETVEGLRAAQKKRRQRRDYRAARSEALRTGLPAPPIPENNPRGGGET